MTEGPRETTECLKGTEEGLKSTAECLEAATEYGLYTGPERKLRPVSSGNVMKDEEVE